jgi:rhodanese-related sulfurtransferase
MTGRAREGQSRVLLAGVLVAVSGMAAAADDGVPKGAIIVQAEDVIRLAREHDDLILIDSRSRSDREMGYIEDSLSLPDDQTNCTTLSQVSKRFDQPMVFYCNGVKCGRSHHAVQMASSCGYSKLYWFKDGYEEWREKHFPVLRSH